MKIFFNHIKSTGKFFTVLLISVFSFFQAEFALAQSSTQVTIIGVPPVLSSPFTDDIQINFTSGQYQVILNYSGFSSQPVDLVFDFVLVRNGRQLVEITSAPMAFAPGSYVFSSFFEEIQFRETANEILNRLDRELRNQVIQSGTIPEGNYSIEITARPFTQQSGITSLPGRAFFLVRYPTPPILVSVPNNANVTLETPTFSWTPVVSSIGGTFDYEFLLVEVFSEQTPFQAINSNRAHLQQTLTGQTVLPYTFEYLPLEEGARYAWLVTAKDAFGRIPLQNGGESEIYTFTYRDSEYEPLITDLRELESIPLVPGFAELVELSGLEVRETETYYELNGTAVLNLDFDFTDPVQARAGVRGLRIQKSSLDNPTVMGGEITGQIRDSGFLLGSASDYVSANELNWRFGEGISLTAGIQSPDGQNYSASGNLQVHRSGLTGEIYAEGDVLARIGSSPVELIINRINASFPAEFVTAKGYLSSPGSDICELPAISLKDENFEAFIDCNINKKLQLVPGSDLATLRFSNITGSAGGTWDNTDLLDYNLNLSSALRFELDRDIFAAQTCGYAGILNLNSDDGFIAREFYSDCAIPDPYLDLGIFKLNYSNLEISQLVYNGNEDWDFELLVDANLFLPAVQKVPLPTIEEVRITQDGIQFPSIQFDEALLQPFTVFDLDLFEFAMTRFEMENQTFPWFDWDGTGPGMLNVNFDAAITFPDVCKYPLIEFVNASVGTNGITGDLEFSGSGSCKLEFGEGYAINITQWDGEFSLEYRDRIIEPVANLNLDGELVLGEPFVCGTMNNTISLENFNYRLINDGFEAVISDLVPGCPVSVGPYEAFITDSELSLSYSLSGDIGAELNAQAELNLGTEENASGTFTLNLVTGEFSEMDFELEGPFEWGIPKADPILVFQVDRATVNESGLYIDGRQSLLIDDGTMGATFDELVIDWDTFEVIEGRIILDGLMGFEAGIDAGNQLTYNATLKDENLGYDPGVLMKLAGTIVIDSQGLSAAGTSTGELNYGEFALKDLEVVYSDDYAMRLDPFEVRTGAAEIYWNNQRVAIIDESGFRPDLAFFGEEFLPDRIPLPTEEIAYLEIRRNGNLLVDAINMGDGTYKIETRPADPLKMVIPALQGNAAAAPEIEVTLTDFRVNPSTGNFISGMARAEITSGDTGFDLVSMGIPLSLDEIIFTSQSVNENELTALFLNGRLTLLDHEFNENGNVTFFMQSDGHAKGNFSFPNISEEISLEPGSSRVVYGIESLAGYIDIPVTGPGIPDFQIAMAGNFQVNNFGNEPLASAALEAELSEQGFTVTHFDAGSLIDNASFDFEFFRISIDQIKTLSLSYSDETGFDYFADLDMQLEMLLPDDVSIEIPLKNIDLRSRVGIVIPDQDIHDGSNPVLTTPDFDLGVFRLKPLAFRMERDTLNIHELNAGDLLSLLPEIDLEVTFPTYSSTAPELSQISLSINSVGFKDGILTGSIIPYSTGDNPITLPVGPVGISIELFEGSLFETDDGSQGFSIDLDGKFVMPDFFSNSASPCSDTQVGFSLTSDGGISGRAEQFMPCGELVLGPLSLGFGESVLELVYENDQQLATLAGNAAAELEREGLSPVTANGNLEYDLLNGNILSGSITIDDPFTWYLPAENPLFEFTVQNAVIDSDGLKFNGNGDLELGDGSVGVSFNDLAFSLSDGSVSSGSVEILNEFAVDVKFGPTRWAVSDPSGDIDFNSGIRLRMPSNITIDQSGFTASGQSTASLRFAEESHDGLMLDLSDLTVGLKPVSVISGRADLILDDNGTPVRLAYYDSNGFHLDNLAGALAMPDTLGLPTKDIAYIVLRDEQGQNLVQSNDVEGGLELFTTQPVPLVFAGLENAQGNSPQINVSFSNVVVNAALEVVSGAISADVSDTPLNLTNYGNFPIGLTAVHFKKEGTEPYQLYADAKLSLPESLRELEVIIENLILGEDGFKDAVFTAGNYTLKHTEGSSQPVATQSFAADDLIFSVRGVEMQFGNAPGYKFSGDLKSGFLTNADGDSVNIHFAAEFVSNDWIFNLDTDHLFPQELPIGNAKLVLDDLSSESDQNDFNLVLDGRLQLPELAGNDFQIGLEGLRIGTSGVSVAGINTNGLTPQRIGLFGQPDNLTINDLNLSISAGRHLLLTTSGELSFLDRDFPFSDLRIGTDGTFQLGSGNVSLINASNPIELMDQYLVLKELRIGIQNNKVELTAGGTASMPEPLQSTAGFSITVDHTGSSSVTGPSFTFSNANVDLGDFAEFKLTGAGLQINSLHQADMTLYASAEIDIDGDVIQFGTPGNPFTWGIRYRMNQQKLEWNITNTPRFEFDAGFFKMNITNVSMTDSQGESFGVSISANAKFKLEGIGGSGLQMENFTITSAGIGSMGEVVGGGFSLASAISVEVGQFSWGKDEDITIIRQSGSDNDPGSVEETIRVDEYLRFGSENGSAVSITIEGGFHGEVGEIFYYKNTSSFYLNIEGVDVRLSDHARLFASFEYEKQPDGFMLKVAGGGSFDTPGGQSYGIAAMGRMSTLNNEFSFGIFVAVQAEIPVFPGVISLTEVGGGFFYKATNQDFEDVAALTNYQFYGEKPWIEKSGNYDFAIVVYAGVGLLGMGGAYALEGSAILLITDQWFAMDVKGSYLGFDEQMSGGMYLEVQWDPFVSISGGGGGTLDFGFLLSGSLDVSFFAIEDWQNSSNGEDIPMIWGVTANNDLEIIGGVATAKAEFMISSEGFYVGIEVGGGFDIWVISVSTTWKGSIWWIYGEQFGAYVEINFNATLFKVAEIGATLKGALIIDNGYLVYASANAYVSVLFVFKGNVGVWVSMKNGKLRGGKGSNSEYESMIDDARNKARDMSRKMQETLNAMEDLKNAPQIFTISDDILAAAGEQMVGYMNSILEYNRVIAAERGMTTVPSLHEDIRNYIALGERKTQEFDYNLEGHETTMLDELNSLTSIVNQVEGRFEEVYDMAIEWEDEAAMLLDDVVNDPVMSANTEADSENGVYPSFSIDPVQANTNVESLENLKEAIDQLDAKFTAAIDSVVSYIKQIDRALSLQISISGLPTLDPLTGTFQASSGGLSISSQPSANMISEQYIKTTESIDRYYGNMVDYKWDNHFWAIQKLANFENLRSGSLETAVIQASENMLRNILPNMTINFANNTASAGTTIHLIPNSSVGVNMTSTLNAASSRIYNIYRFNPNYNNSQALQEKSKFESEMRNHLPGEDHSFLLSFVSTGLQYWYETPVLGYSSIRDSSISIVNQLVDDYKERMNDLSLAHENFTSLVNDIYRSKAALTMTLHGMVDLYSAEKEALAGDSAAAPLYQLKQEIEEQLRPPVITNISVSDFIEDYNNRITLNWNATHPTGNIIENSYFMEPGSNISVLARGMLSTGSETEVTRYLFKERLNESSRNMRVVVRARGPSGTTISKPATFTGNVDNSSNSGTSGGTDRIDFFDVTPPSLPYISFGYKKTTRRFLNNINGRFEWVDYETYWTNKIDEIVFNAFSTDTESDIAAFEYSVGSFKGGRDIVDWTEVQGERLLRNVSQTSNMSGADNIAQKITIRNLSIDSGAHYISVRAINGRGLKSSVKEVKQSIMYDGDPPTAPTFKTVQIPILNSALSDYQTPVTSAPLYENPPAKIRVSPSIRLEWNPSSDERSGIQKYEYITSTEPEVEAAFSQAEQVNSTRNTIVTLYRSPVSYSDSVYVHMRALDNAGLYSEFSTFGPFIAPDPSRPLTPKIKARGKSNEIGFHLIRPSLDWESPIDRYEYTVSVGLGPDKFPWRRVDTSSAIWSLALYTAVASMERSANGAYAPYLGVSKNNLSPGELLMMKVRAINKQGIVSGIGMSYPVVYDTTPPVNPSISTSVSGSTMTVNVNNLHDPESGVIKVEYRVYDTSLTNFINREVVSWTDLVSFNGIRRNKFNTTVSVNIANRFYNNLRVYVRITNANGMQTTVTHTPILMIPKETTQTNYNLNFDFNF